MILSDVELVYALLAGIMSIALTIVGAFFEKDKKRGTRILIWAALFLAIAFGASENALWNEGYNLFEIVLGFNFPLVAFFGVWFAFLAWLFESRGERKVWVALLVALIVLVVVAANCMNCINF
jgi:FtsH-binding integral membrane protein